MTESAGIARLEKAIDKLSDATEKQTDTLHAIQLEQRGMAGSITAIELLAKQTARIAEDTKAELDGTKDKVMQLDSVVMGEGGLSDEVKLLKKEIIIRDGPARMDRAEADIKLLQGPVDRKKAFWSVLSESKQNLLLLGFFVALLVYAMNYLAPSRVGIENNKMLKEITGDHDD